MVLWQEAEPASPVRILTTDKQLALCARTMGLPVATSAGMIIGLLITASSGRSVSGRSGNPAGALEGGAGSRAIGTDNAR